MSHLAQLRTFLEAYRKGSISKATIRVGLTQPAASAHIRALEAALGRPLFEQQARGLTATPAAHDLARSVAAHLDGLEGAIEAAKARSTALSGTVHLAGPAEFLAAGVVPLLPSLLAEGLTLRVQTGGRDRLYALLEAGEIDLAVTASRPASRGLDWTEIARERLLLVASPAVAARLSGRVLDAPTLSVLPVAAYDDDLPLVREAWRHLFGADPDLRAAVTVPDLQAVERLVVEGAGWSVLPDYLCAGSLAHGSLVPLLPGTRVLDNALHLVWSKGALRRPRVAHVQRRLLAALRSP